MDDDYDVVVIGGGIGGSVSASLLAKKGKKVLLIEREQTPRHKACSGIQFPYFPKLLGVDIPKALENTPLTQTQLTHTEIEYPPTTKGKKKNLRAAFPMSNFMRNTFDDWLNKEAIKSGATFQNKTQFSNLKEENDEIIVNMDILDDKGQKSGLKSVKTKYVIGADGVNSTVRKQMRPTDFSSAQKEPQLGGGINYYIKPTDPSKIKIPKTTLLQIWNTDYNNEMFAWVYIKDEPRCTEDDTRNGKCTNAWVVGTAYDGKDLDKVGKNLLKYVSDTYRLDGEILREEKMRVDLNLIDQSKRFAFGDGKNGNVLYVGDSAGLIDAVRGLGMDASALSSHKAVNSILEHEACKSKGKSDCKTPSQIYAQKMQKIQQQLSKNSQTVQEKKAFSDNDQLSVYLNKELGAITGIKKILCSKFNMWKNPEDMNLC